MSVCIGNELTNALYMHDPGINTHKHVLFVPSYFNFTMSIKVRSAHRLCLWYPFASVHHSHAHKGKDKLHEFKKIVFFQEKRNCAWVFAHHKKRKTIITHEDDTCIGCARKKCFIHEFSGRLLRLVFRLVCLSSQNVTIWNFFKIIERVLSLLKAYFIFPVFISNKLPLTCAFNFCVLFDKTK